MANPADLSGFDEFIAECRKTHDVLKQQLEQAVTAFWKCIPTAAKPVMSWPLKLRIRDEDTELVTFALNLFDIVGINQMTAAIT